MRRPVLLAMFLVAMLALTISPSGYSQLDNSQGNLPQPKSAPRTDLPANGKYAHGKDGHGKDARGEDPLDVRPIVHRAGKLPAGLPPWFMALDADEDGQVSLDEWYAAGGSLNEFLRFDLDDDGLITPDEVLRTLKRGAALRLEHGQADIEDTIEEPTGEMYRSKKAFKAFTIAMEAGRSYRIEQNSQDFDSYFYLVDSSGEILARGASNAKGQAARIVHRALETETCRIIATSQAGIRSGDFSMSIRVLNESGASGAQELPAWFRNLDRDHDGQISLHEWRRGGKKLADFRKYDLDGDGLITAEEVLRPLRTPIKLKLKQGQAKYDGALESTDVRHQGKKLAKVFTVDLPAGRTYQFDHMSKAFDAFLSLEDAGGAVLAQNDDGGDGTNSRIVYQVEGGGTYRLVATSLSGNGLGPFSITVRAVGDDGSIAPKGLPAWLRALDTDRDGQVSIDEWWAAKKRMADFWKYDLDGDGFITAAEMTRSLQEESRLKLVQGKAILNSAIEEATGEKYRDKKTYRIFTIKLEAGRTYQIEQVSQVYYAYLLLEDSDGEILAKHNSGGRGKMARVVHRATRTEVCRIIATSQDGYKTGPFSMLIRLLADTGPIARHELPAWFKDLDANDDGQISLPEWRQAGLPFAWFRQLDLDDDGFITTEEALRQMPPQPPRPQK